ncbi:MAG: glutaredoxin 3 [Gammaproteobacteria bacterium]|nr:glutaredoxin 3 [Gammaproteobacteria bacterium]
MDLNVVVYESAFCPYCMWAKRLLDAKQISYTLINVDRDAEKRTEMENLSGRYTVPQIFFGDRHIGGYDDLSALERSGELDQVIQEAAAS